MYVSCYYNIIVGCHGNTNFPCNVLYFLCRDALYNTKGNDHLTFILVYCLEKKIASKFYRKKTSLPERCGGKKYNQTLRFLTRNNGEITDVSCKQKINLCMKKKIWLKVDWSVSNLNILFLFFNKYM